MSLSLILIGVLSLLCQVVLLRELNVAFYGVELVYLLALTSWMLGTAAGAAFAPPRWPADPRRLTAVLVGVPALLPLAVIGIRGSRGWLGAVPGAYLPIDLQLGILLAATLPPAIALGMAFRWAAARALSEGGNLGRAYGVESAGFAAAGGLATLAFHLGAQTFTVATAGGSAALVALLFTLAARRRTWFWLAIPAAAAGGWLILASGEVDRRLTAWNHPGLVATADSPYGRITSVGLGSQRAIFENDVLAFESGDVEQEVLAHVTALQHPLPKQVLVLGGAVRQLQDELALHHPSAITVVEQDEVLVEMGRAGPCVRPPAPATRPAALVKVVIDDPRQFLHAPDRYDLILVGTGPPDSGLSNRFYTREFFEACARRLAPGGVLGLTLPLPDAFLAPHVLRRAASIVAALDAVFPNVEILPGTSTLAVASGRPLPKDETMPIARLEQRGIEPRLVRARYLRYLYRGERRQTLPARLRAADVPPNTDVRPICYQYALLIWLARFVPAAHGFDLVTAAPGAAVTWWTALAAAVFLALVRLRPAWRTAGLALVAGFAGMVLETLVLLRYQASRGALFVDIGLLVTAFMAGLSVGSWGAGRAAAVHRAGLLRAVTCALLAGVAAVAALSALRGDLLAASLGHAAISLAAVGLLVGALFGCAAARQPLGERGAGRLYAADVIGGAVGSLAATVLLVPLAGLEATALLVAAVALATLTIP